MSNTFLSEFQVKVNECNSVNSYFDTLAWGIKECENFEDGINTFADPFAAVIVEVFVQSPEAVRLCALSHERVATIYRKFVDAPENNRLVM